MTEPGLRARKMARTRKTIADAALAAFMAQGYGATRLEEIAEAAGVHKRTLLRYFPTKTHLVLYRQHAALETFETALAGRGERAVVDVWQDHVIAHSRKLVNEGAAANIGKIAALEPSVRQAALELRQQYQRLISRALHQEAGGGKDSLIWSKVVAAALVGGNYAVGDWIMREEAYGEFEVAESEVLRLVREGFFPRKG